MAEATVDGSSCKLESDGLLPPFPSMILPSLRSFTFYFIDDSEQINYTLAQHRLIFKKETVALSQKRTLFSTFPVHLKEY